MIFTEKYAKLEVYLTTKKVLPTLNLSEIEFRKQLSTPTRVEGWEDSSVVHVHIGVSGQGYGPTERLTTLAFPNKRQWLVKQWRKCNNIENPFRAGQTSASDACRSHYDNWIVFGKNRVRYSRKL